MTGRTTRIITKGTTPGAFAMTSRSSASDIRHVLVLVESSAGYGRGCLRGIGRYVRNHQRWRIRHMPHDQMPVLNPNIPWRCDWDGVIARISNRRLVQLVRRLNLPTVDIMGAMKMRRVAVVDADHQRIVELAIEHLIANGLTNLGFCGVPGLSFSDTRQEIFQHYSSPRGVTLHSFDVPAPPRRRLEGGGGQRWLRDLKLLRAWLEGLPKPVGIIACNDTRARHVIEVCMAAGLSVPREVAVVGVDNDDAICETCAPMLSSVDPNSEAVGFEAARLLDALMQGQPPPAKPVVIAPLGVEGRDSSDIGAFQHRDLNDAIEFIRERQSADIDVGSVVAHVGSSRSTLERRFRQHLGCTLHHFIQRNRIDRAKRLLLETNYPAAHIARMLRFNTSTYFTAAFRKQVGVTPGQFRRQHTPGGA